MIALAGAALAGAQGHDDAITSLLLALVILLPVAKLSGIFAEKLGQPAVMGELMAGLILGNLGLVGFTGIDFLKTDAGLEILAQLGVILLLFEIGLDASLADLMKVGASSLLVAAIGVIFPFALGWLVSAWLLPGHSSFVHAFVGATLCATSVGITARVLQDIGAIRTQEAKIILGAAVIDDVLGLLILAVVSGMIIGADKGTEISLGSISYLIGTAVFFLAGSLYLGIWLVPHVFHHASKTTARGLLFSLSLTLCFLLSYFSAAIGLAPIVGAFAAGLILESVPMEKYLQTEELSPDKMLHPLSVFLVPLFFVQMGLKIELASLFRIEVLGLAAALTVVAILGKQACGLGAIGKNLNRLSIGIGMIPRGEVGLIFAGIGLTLAVKGERILDEAVFSAILIMVMVTTIVTPPLLQWSFRSRAAHNK
ncbi:MAG: Na+/H+ antiporter [Deltaproteobacteria bacterium]|nr:Na+/H+ antiporter [Deltaproteobacteria bacterium]